MPGIIRDPRMNSKEDKYGIIQFGAVLAYYKKVDMDGNDLEVEIEGSEEKVNIRYLPTGWRLNGSAWPVEQLHWKDWDGIPIYHKASISGSQPLINQGPVTMNIRKFIEANPMAIFTNKSEIGSHRHKNSGFVDEIKELLDKE